MKGKSKGDTLKLLSGLGLNVPIYHVIVKPFTIDDVIDGIRRFATPMISIRTWSQERMFLCPFSPHKDKLYQETWVATNWDRLKNLNEIILAQGINPEDSVMCGKASHFKDRDCVLYEYMTGPGTVRDMEKSSSSDLKRLYIGNGVNTIWPDNGRERGPITVLHRMCIPVFRVFHNCTVEWSMYDYAIGKKNQPFIFWEII